MKNKIWKISLGLASALCASALAVAIPSVNSANAEGLQDVNVTLKMGGAGVRMTGEKDEAIRFRAGLKTTEYDALSSYDVSFGMLVIPEAQLQGELSLENDVKGVSIINVPVKATNATYEEGDMTYYNVALANIPDINYTSDILARGYMIISDGTMEKTIYSNTQTRSLAYVAYRETLANQNLTDTESSALTNYMSGKDFYPVSVEDGAGLTLDYDYAFAGQVLNLNWDLDGKYMKTVSVNGDTSIFSWSNGKITMPAEETVVDAELREQTDTPTVLGANGGKYYAVGAGSANIGSATEIKECETEQISDADYQALLDAGYKGSIKQGTVTKAVHPTRATMGNASNVSFGVALDGLTMVDIFESSGWADVQNRYYVSIWLKVDYSYNWAKNFTAFDVENRTQATGGDVNWDTIPANTWWELRFPLSALRLACNWVSGASGSSRPDNLSFGLYNYHSNCTADTTLSIYSIELMLNDVETNTASSADLTYTGGNPLANSFVKVNGFDIYDGETKLVAGEDYTVDGNTVNGLRKGSYKVQYNLVSSTIWGGCLNAYPNGAVITRKLVVTQSYPVVVDDMSTAGSVKAYTQTHSGASQAINDCASIISQSATISDVEYQALLDAGYNGIKTNLDAQTVTFGTYTTRQNVYFQFDKTMTNEILAEVIENKDSSVYVSIWLKSSNTFNYATYTSIIGQTTKKATTHSKVMNSDANGYVLGNSSSWFELKLAVSDLLPTSWDLNNGYLSANESYACGFVLSNAANNTTYLGGAIFTIYSMEICKA